MSEPKGTGATWRWPDLWESAKTCPYRWAFLPVVALFTALEWSDVFLRPEWEIPGWFPVVLLGLSALIGPLVIWHQYRPRGDLLERWLRERKRLIVKWITDYGELERSFRGLEDRARRLCGDVPKPDGKRYPAPRDLRCAIRDWALAAQDATDACSKKRGINLGVLTPRNVSKALPSRDDDNPAGQWVTALHLMQVESERCSAITLQANYLANDVLRDVDLSRGPFGGS